MAFGIYVHIPYCIQRCTYCDFATYEQSSILPPSEYIEFLLKEIRVYAHLLRSNIVNTIYFGGGTPSLIEPMLLKKVIDEIKNQGFVLDSDIEITIEINPATIHPEKIKAYVEMGVNRFSVGAQTFKDSHLKFIGREHDSNDTIETLKLLTDHKLNYSFDILFALPRQTMEELELDLTKVEEFNPNHVSPYCLTVAQSNPLAKNRMNDDGQSEMFERIRKKLLSLGYIQYEISNFAKPNFESRHNTIYWADQPYWGIGLSAHSYSQFSTWGERFWNMSSIQKYIKWVDELSLSPQPNILGSRPSDTFEVLKKHQSLTDFCHTSMRMLKGLNIFQLQAKFGDGCLEQVEKSMQKLKSKGWVDFNNNSWQLTENGIFISNQVFAELTFLEEDLLIT